MTVLEISLIALSILETIVTITLHLKMKKKLNEEKDKLIKERIKLINERIVYENLVELLPTGRNTL